MNKKGSTDIGSQDLVVVAGRKAVQELLQYRLRHCERLLLQEKLRFPQPLQGLVEESALEIEICSRDRMEEISPGHQGIAVFIKPSESVELDVLIDRSLSRAKRIVVLDCVVDPHNVGAIMRVTEALGFDGIVITTDRSAPISAVVRKVSRGSSELLTISKVKNLNRALDALKRSGFWIVGTGLGDDSQSLYEASLPEPIAVVFGSEGSGMRELTRKSCDLVVSIPLFGSMQSLNVSQAASIVLSEIVRSNGHVEPVQE